MKAWLIKNQVKLATGITGASWFMPMAALAQVTTPPSKLFGTGFQNFEEAIRTIFNIVIVAAGIIFVMLVLIGGIQYLAAAGNEENTKKARQYIIDGVIGLVIVLMAWAVGTYVLRLLGLTQSPSEIPTSR